MHYDISGFWLNWKITFNNKYPNCVILYSQLIQYMHSTRFHLLTVNSWLSMKPHFTTNAQNIFHFTPTRLITHRRNLSKVPERCRMVWQGRKMGSWSVVSCTCSSVHYGVQVSPQVDRYRAEVGTTRYIGLYWYERSASFCCGKLTPKVRPSILDTSL